MIFFFFFWSQVWVYWLLCSPGIWTWPEGVWSLTSVKLCPGYLIMLLPWSGGFLLCQLSLCIKLAFPYWFPFFHVVVTELHLAKIPGSGSLLVACDAQARSYSTFASICFISYGGIRPLPGLLCYYLKVLWSLLQVYLLLSYLSAWNFSQLM